MSVYKCDYPDCGFSTNWFQSLKRHKKTVHAPDRLPDDLPIEKYSKMPKAKRVNYSPEEKLVSIPSKQNDGLAEFLLEQRQEEIRAKQEYDHNGKMVVFWISLMALVVAIIYFKDSILMYWKKFKMQQIELKQTEKDAATSAIVNQGEVNEIGNRTYAAQIIPRTSQNHDLTERERRPNQ
ncbi:MAG: hypothetical protein M1477_05715 [Candidatus Thermoplasmatota archaeon]|nr:hypothetical protein [Candidatus Thermoplasmatota archaeon]